MATILKCKMCGGDIEVSQDMTVGKCLYCGSTMTLPKIESEKKARLFNRANEYRLNNEFDKAYDAYKTITEEDEQEAEAYWGMILSEYGVEYVEDPTSNQRIPTCHRTQIQSILDNTNFSLALKYSSGESKFMYQEEAEFLDKLQRQVISISSKIEPYDVFICYKETDDVTGERTKDSDIAENIYNELEKNGIRTFFARITLEEHLGENYEPYIYAALKSARVMLVVTTETSHCEAVWVKNEWSRFLHFMSEDDSKVLIPIYQDMNVYDFPKALASFQMQDMSKIGALNDLVRGVKKVLGTTRTESRDATLQALVADKLNREENERKRKQRTKLFIGVGSGILTVIVVSIVFLIYVNSNLYKYNKSVRKMKSGEYIEAYTLLDDIKGYKDSNELYNDCKNKAFKQEVFLKYSNARVGDVIQLGNDGLEWTCINNQDDYCILICNKVLSRRIVRAKVKDYLNNDFVNDYLSTYEKEILLDNQNNSVGLLSEEQVIKYFPSAEERIVENVEGKDDCWYLNTNSDDIVFVNKEGLITSKTIEDGFTHPYAGVRPTLFISTQEIPEF